MSTMSVIETNSGDVDAILVAFAEATKEGGAKVAEWSDRYPTLARDFARIAADSFANDPQETIDTTQLERLRTVGRTRLAALRTQQTAPLASLLNATQGRTAPVLAEWVGLPVAYIAKLERRLFALESLPRVLIEKIASAVDRSVEDVTVFLSGSPTLARGAAYRSDNAPTLGKQEDFLHLLASDDTVSEESKTLYGEE